MIVQLDEDAKDAVLSLCQTDILGKLQALSIELDAKAGCSYVFLPKTGAMIDFAPV